MPSVVPVVDEPPEVVVVLTVVVTETDLESLFPEDFEVVVVETLATDLVGLFTGGGGAINEVISVIEDKFCDITCSANLFTVEVRLWPNPAIAIASTKFPKTAGSAIPVEEKLTGLTLLPAVFIIFEKLIA